MKIKRKLKYSTSDKDDDVNLINSNNSNNKNKKKNKSQGLEGVLYIDQNTFGIAKAIMRIKGVLDISGTHDFNFLTQEKVWFPSSKSFKIVN